MQPIGGFLQTAPEAVQDLGERLTTLSTGSLGIRSSLPVDSSVPPDAGDLPLIDFIASDETVDRYEEVINVAGWELDHYRRNPVVVDSHDYSSILRVLGRSPLVEVRNGKLVNRVQFATDNPMGKIAWDMARHGFIRAESVGFIPKEWERGKSDDEPRRTYTRQELIEISLVAVPANPNALVLAAKSGAVDRGDLRELHQLLNWFVNQTESEDHVRAAVTDLHAAHSDLVQTVRAIKGLLR